MLPNWTLCTCNRFTFFREVSLCAASWQMTLTLSQILHDILRHDHTCIQGLPPSFRHLIKPWLCYRTGPYTCNRFTFFREVSLCAASWQMLWIPGPVPFGTCICSNFETIISWTCHVYGPFEFRKSLGTSFLLNSYLNYCFGEWEGWDPVNRFNHTSWVAIATPTDCPKSVQNRNVIGVFVDVLYRHVALDFSVGEGSFDTGLIHLFVFLLQ